MDDGIGDTLVAVRATSGVYKRARLIPNFHDWWRQYFAEPTRPLSKFVDHIHAEKELVSGISVVVSRAIPRVIEAKFRTEHNRGPDVSGEIKRIFRIFPGDPGTLSFLVVEQVRSESEHKFGGDLAIYVVNDRVLGSSAA